jgi:hypothetical protein
MLGRPSGTAGGLDGHRSALSPDSISALLASRWLPRSLSASRWRRKRFHDRALANSERELKTPPHLAEQTDRAFQSLDLVLTSVIERMQSPWYCLARGFQERMSGQDTQSLLKDKISGLPHIDAVSLFDVDGKMINLSRFWPVPNLNNADRKYFLAFKSDPKLNSFVSEPVVNRATGTWTVFLVRRLTDPSGKFLGVINGAMELAFFEKLFGAVVLNEHSSIALLRSDGMLLARYPRLETIIGTVFTGANNALGARDSGTYRLTGVVDGGDRLMASHRLAAFPLMITVATDVEAALADWRRERNFLIGAGAWRFSPSRSYFFSSFGVVARTSMVQAAAGVGKAAIDTAINNVAGPVAVR